MSQKSLNPPGLAQNFFSKRALVRMLETTHPRLPHFSGSDASPGFFLTCASCGTPCTKVLLRARLCRPKRGAGMKCCPRERQTALHNSKRRYLPPRLQSCKGNKNKHKNKSSMQRCTYFWTAIESVLSVCRPFCGGFDETQMPLTHWDLEDA